ncbi:MAG: hypothetical protein M0002_10015 [Rhodospirillales bacterium]|nr:hypothetical protein [Rhodospirillales bacterium]
MLAELPAGGGPGLGLSVGMGMPLLRGKATVGSYALTGSATPSPDLFQRIAALNASDPLPGPAITEGLREQHFDEETFAVNGEPEHEARGGYDFPALAAAAGKLLAAPAGPRIVRPSSWKVGTRAATRRLFSVDRLPRSMPAWSRSRQRSAPITAPPRWPS